MTITQALSILIFILVFLLIGVEAIHKTYAALLGALGMTLIGAVRPEEILDFIDIEILAVILGLFLLVKGAERSGLFRLMAAKIMTSSSGPKSFAVILLSFSILLAVFVSNIGAMLITARARSPALQSRPYRLLISSVRGRMVDPWRLWIIAIAFVLINVEV